MNRAFIYRMSLFLNYWVVETYFKNKHFQNAQWFIREEWFVKLGFEKHLFDIVDIRYDGHTVKGITILGISVAYGYTYDSRALTEWTHEELITQE